MKRTSRLLAGLLAAMVTLAAQPLAAQQEPHPPAGMGPLDTIPLAGLGYADVTLREYIVTAEFFVPGPGEYAPASSDHWLDLDFLPSEQLTTDSYMSVAWNGLPLADRGIGGGIGRTRLTAAIPVDRVDPDINKVSVMATLVLPRDICTDYDSPARHLTLLNTSQIRYAYLDRVARPRGFVADLSRYPAPLVVANAPQAAPVIFVIPPSPTAAEMTAFVRLAAHMGGFGGSRGVRIDVVPDAGLEAQRLSQGHVVFVGRQDALPSLAHAALPAPLARATDGALLGPGGAPVAAGEGVIYQTASPWNPSRALLAATGLDDDGVEKAAMALSSRAGVRSLRGPAAVVADVAPVLAPEEGPQVLRLSDLGRGEQTMVGVGTHNMSFTLDVPRVAERGSVPFEVVVSHSALLDRARSSLKVLLNGVPVSSTGLNDLAPTRSRVRVDLPASALRTGPNSVGVELHLQIPNHYDGQNCVRPPYEHAWVVVHGESAFTLSAPPATGPNEAPSLGSYPYPLLRNGRLDDALLVIPERPEQWPTVARLASDLGRSVRADAPLLRAVSAQQFDPARDAATRDVMLVGTPADNPVIGVVGEYLPIWADEGQRLVLSRELTVAVRDLTQLGVLQVIGSPWSADRGVLVVTGTGGDGLRLAAEALWQGNLGGNAALVSRREALPPMPGRAPTPEPLSLGGASTEQLQTSTYRLRPRTDTTGEARLRRPPYALIAAGAVGGLVVVLAAGLAFQAFVAGRAADRRDS